MGEFAGVHGIRGAIKVFSHAESPEIFKPGHPLRIVDPRGAEQTHVIDWARPHKNGLLMALKGITTREAAESLVHSAVYVRKADLPVLEEGTYYWFELIGVSVVDATDGYLGRIGSVITTGSNDVYAVTDETGREILIPALASVIQSVDLTTRTMCVDLPSDLKPVPPEAG